MKSSRVWSAFLPIGSVSTADKVEEVDADWLASRGCTEGALRVLRAIRYEVLPVIKQLDHSRINRRQLERFSFLIHDRTSGVPCPPEDSSAYVHLRLVFDRTIVYRELRVTLPVKWCYLTPVTPTVAEERVHDLLDWQCAWYVRLTRENEKASDLELLKLVRQHLHYFANMAQMRVQ